VLIPRLLDPQKYNFSSEKQIKYEVSQGADKESNYSHLSEDEQNKKSISFQQVEERLKTRRQE
jgi:hypothetical protein